MAAHCRSSQHSLYIFRCPATCQQLAGIKTYATPQNQPTIFHYSMTCTPSIQCCYRLLQVVYVEQGISPLVSSYTGQELQMSSPDSVSTSSRHRAPVCNRPAVTNFLAQIAPMLFMSCTAGNETFLQIWRHVRFAGLDTSSSCSATALRSHVCFWETEGS